MITQSKEERAAEEVKPCLKKQINPLGSTARLILIAAGSISLGLGVLGIFLPVLPTTPFLLLASFCFMRSSPRIHSWLINHRVLGEYLYFYTKHKAIRKRTRIIALASLWSTLLLSGLVIDKLHVRLIMLAFGLGVSVHLMKLRTVDRNRELLDERRKDCTSAY